MPASYTVSYTTSNSVMSFVKKRTVIQWNEWVLITLCLKYASEKPPFGEPSSPNTWTSPSIPNNDQDTLPLGLCSWCFFGSGPNFATLQVIISLFLILYFISLYILWCSATHHQCCILGSSESFNIRQPEQGTQSRSDAKLCLCSATPQIKRSGIGLYFQVHTLFICFQWDNSVLMIDVRSSLLAVI